MDNALLCKENFYVNATNRMDYDTARTEVLRAKLQTC